MSADSPPPGRRAPRPHWWWLVVGAGLLLVVAGASLLLLGGDGAPNAQASGPAPAGQSLQAFKDCRTCHRDLDLALLTGRAMKGMLFSHDKHFAKGEADCASCHVADPHGSATPASAYAAVKPDHLRCFSCHGSGTGTVQRTGPMLASGECDTCHAKGTIPKPASHTVPTWLDGGHGAAAQDPVTGPTCLTCHTKADCTKCHGLEMPHPAGFGGAPHGRLASTTAGRALCATCHGKTAAATTSFCESCHHPGKPGTTSMVTAHPGLVSSQGESTCYTCHDKSAFCTKCHGIELPHPAGWSGSSHASAAAARGSALCARCHGSGASTCDSCHHSMKPAGTSIVAFHGRYVRNNGSSRCLTCHRSRAFCTSCHGGVVMPHPAGFSGSGHTSTAARLGTKVCARCHSARACTSCHGGVTMPHASGFAGSAHTRAAANVGTSVCYRCHSRASFCTKCHGVVMPHPSGFSGSGHVSTASSVGTGVCTRCHSGGTAFCEACHHPMKSASQSMRSFHQGYVESHGYSTCVRCHTISTFCYRCHNGPGGGD